jgi:hypothetical protein
VRRTRGSRTIAIQRIVIDINVHVESLAVHGRALIHLFFELEDSRAFDGDVICTTTKSNDPK